MINVLTLTWNGVDKLRRLKDGLFRNLEATGEDYHIYIRDNGSKDDTVKELEVWPNTTVIQMDHNRDNFSQGMNNLANEALANLQIIDQNIKLKARAIGYSSLTSLAAAYGKFLFLNNDVVFGDDVSLKKMVNLMDLTGAAIIGARLLYPDSNLLQHAGVAFSERYNRMPYHLRHKEPSDAAAEQNRFFQVVTAACCLVNPLCFFEVGGFCEQYHWAFDDVDLCLSIGEQGHRIAYCGETKIYHGESESLRKNPVNKMFLQHNVKTFRSRWDGKYEIDYERYLGNTTHNAI